MAISQKVNETLAVARKLRADTDDAFLTSLRTELAIVRSMCLLARQENGQRRTRHMKLAQTAFAMVLELAERVEPAQPVLDDIDQARRDILMLGARNFSRSISKSNR